MKGIHLMAAGVAAALAAGCSAVADYPVLATAPSAAASSCSGSAYRPGIDIGIMAPGFPPSKENLISFERATGVQPGLIAYDQPFGDGFNASAACYAIKHRAVPLIQVPLKAELAGVAAGKYDAYLGSYARSVRIFGARLALSFGAGINNGGQDQAEIRASARLFVVAWRHIVAIFHSEGADNVKWLWVIKALGPQRPATPREWWPGSNYVSWVGIDAYYSQPSQSFGSLLGPSILAVRDFTHDPIILAETGVSRSAGQAAKIPGLFTGIHAYGLLGFVWRDAASGGDTRLENDPAAVAAFRRSVRRLNQ